MSSYDEAVANLRELTTALMKRLQLELVEEPATLRQSTSAAKPTFVRYPAQIRLSTRIDRNGRESQTIKAPAEIFDLTLSPQQRSDVLVNKGLLSLLQKAISNKESSHLRIINIAAVNFSEEQPPEDVRKLFTQDSKKNKRPRAEDGWTNLQGTDVDESVLDQLPPELAEELRKSLKMPKKKNIADALDQLVACDWPK